MIKRWAALAACAAIGASGFVGACGGTNDAQVGAPPGEDDGGATQDGTTGSTRACVPGAQVACACPGSSRGAQVCNADGTGFGPCMGCGGSLDATLPGDDASGGGDDDSSTGDDGSSAIDSSGGGDASDGASDFDVQPRDSGHERDALPPPDAGEDAACSTVAVPAARAPVFMLFALDGSGSMNDSSKWTSATAAIDAVFGDMQKKADPGLGAGLIVFSDTNDPTCQVLGLGCTGPYPSTADVPIAFVDSTQLSKLDARTASPDGPSGDTPTSAVLTGGYGELASFAPQPPLPPSGKKVLVLITDGAPTDRCMPSADGGASDYTQNPCVQEAAQSLAKGSPQGPIETFVIGVGTLPGDFSSYDPYFLGALAQAGGTAPKGCNPKENAAGAKDLCYFNVDPAGSASATQAALEGALDDIRGQVATCTIPIVLGSAGPLDPARFNVELGTSTIVPEDAANGWTYDNPILPQNVLLHGAACATITNAPSTKITFLLGCPTQVH